MKAFFLSRALREKILLVALIVGAAAMWLSGAGKRAGTFWRDVSATSSDLKDQEMVLGQREAIEARSLAAIGQLDPSKTFDQVRLQSEINTIVNSAGLAGKATISGAPSDKAGQFSVHTVQVSIRNGDWKALTDFYRELQKRSPYMGIVSFDLFSTSAANGHILSQTMKISSMQF